MFLYCINEGAKIDDNSFIKTWSDVTNQMDSIPYIKHSKRLHWPQVIRFGSFFFLVSFQFGSLNPQNNNIYAKLIESNEFECEQFKTQNTELVI